MKDFLSENRLPLAAFVVALAVYAGTAADRLRRPSSDPHFVVQADAWLHGRLDVPDWPPAADDAAKVEEVRLKSGEILKGRRIDSRSVFHAFSGREVPTSSIDKSLSTKNYVSFPAFPSVVMLPQAALFGRRANDVATTAFFAALVPALLLVLLRRIRRAGLSTRTPTEEAWLAVLLAFGSVFYFCAVQGRVWFTAHVIAVVITILYAWVSIEAAHPAWAGFLLGLAVVTRGPQMVFLAPFFLFEAWRAGPAVRWRRILAFGAPLLAVGVVAAVFNQVRFGSPLEFGHSYLAVRQQTQIERYGHFSLHYLQRNLTVALTLLPYRLPTRPWFRISGHGLALWLTTPALFLLLWPRVKNALFRPALLSVALVAACSLCYQNSGWLQFGYRFSLDYMVFLVVLLAIGGRPLNKVAKGLIIAGVLINLFGAVTFNRAGQFYDQNYDCVVQN